MTIYLEHFGLNEAPFKITPHTEFFFSGANRGETLEALIYAITSGEGMVKVTGEVGAGKTMLCRVLMERLPDTVETIYLAVPSLSPDEMLATIADDLGVDTHGGNTTKLIRALQQRLIATHAEGKQVVALIDEAHAMPLETLEEIRLLSNLETSHDKLMQIVLFGQPELDEHLVLPNMRQLKERITHSFNLMPLPARDIKDYLNFRLRAAGYKGADLFSAEALKLIAEASEGLTRRINIYADKTLLAAYADNTYTVTPDHVRAAISDTQIVLPVAKTGRKIWLAIAASVLLSGAIGFMAGRTSTSGSVSAPVPVTESANGVSRGATSGGAIVANATATPAATSQSAAKASEQAQKSTQKIESPATRSTPAADRVTPVTSAANTEVITPSSPNWLQARMEADISRVGNLPTNRYSIQLMTADPRESSAIEDYLRTASRELNPDRIMVYPVGTRDNPRVSVLYGSFSERVEATDEMVRLPAKLTRFRPYVRSVSAIREDKRSGG